MFAYVSDTNAWVDVLGLEGSTYANAREMTDKEIGRFLVMKNGTILVQNQIFT